MHLGVFLNKGNRFLLKSAKHRVAFFIVQKRRFLPVKISKHDYNVYLNKDVAIKLHKYLINNDINEMNVPIQHPFFYEYPSRIPCYYEQFVYPIIYEIASILKGKYSLCDLTVCDMLNDDGAIARYMAKIGFNAIYSYPCDINLSILLDELTRVNLHYEEKMKQANIIFSDEFNWNKIECKDETIILILFSEKDSFPLINNFDFSKKITHVFWDGKDENIFIFYRSNTDKIS